MSTDRLESIKLGGCEMSEQHLAHILNALPLLKSLCIENAAIGCILQVSLIYHVLV